MLPSEVTTEKAAYEKRFTHACQYGRFVERNSRTVFGHKKVLSPFHLDYFTALLDMCFTMHSYSK